MRAVFIALTMFLAVTSSAPAQEPSALNIRNAGGAACSQFGQVFSGEGNQVDKTAYLQWIAGYSAAVARQNNVVDIFPIIDTLQLVQMVIFVCNENPEVNLEFAILQTAIRLQPFWVRGSTNLLTLTWNDTETKFFEASVTPLQNALKAIGAGLTVDGIYGNQTGAAITQLAKQNGLPASPMPTGAIFYLLTRPQG